MMPTTAFLQPFTDTITFLYTRDLASTARFYEDVLGFQLALDQGSCRIYRIGANGFVGFCERASAQDKPEGVIITFVTDEVDAWADRLKAEAVPLEKPPTLNEEYGIYHIFFRDPNGYLLEIQRFVDPAWRG